jgi:hypothetical protein
VGSVFQLIIAFSWLRVMRLKSTSLNLELVTVASSAYRWFVQAAASWVSGCARVPALCSARLHVYYLEPRLACRRCNGFWYAAQRTSSNGRETLV